MKTISSWSDLRAYGIDVLTGEACGLMYRLLCDVTASGGKLIEKTLSINRIEFAPPWNGGAPDDPHVGSILVPPEWRQALGVFALLEFGCREVWLSQNGALLGIEPSDSPEMIERSKQMCPEALVRTFAYQGTAGDRNLHVMSGRVM